MEKTYEFLKKCGTYFLATADGEQPRVRPFGTAHIFEGRLYFQTGRVKDVSSQLRANPKFELCAFDGGKWLRLCGTAVLDERLEAQKSLLDAYPTLGARYKPGDGNNEVWYIKDATATISSFTDEPVVEKF